jgi:oxygen-independent coproporphyrinogen-3 oxidase
VAANHVYVHVPFCARRCVYCDFAIAVRRAVPVGEFLSALRAEVETRFPDAGAREVDSIYLGGGTPSLLGGDGVARLLDLLRERWRPAATAEVTIEANPDDVTPGAARAWRLAGANRVSLGVQSFDPEVLAWMHRTHDVAAVDHAAEAMAAAGIPRWSLDLIFALPAALGRDWRRDLSCAVALAPDHISCYGLTVEHGTALGHRAARGVASEAPEAEYEDEFLTAHGVLTSAGFEHYEVSNYARPGARAVHNAAYWRRVPYVGLGPSAHGFDGSERRWNLREYKQWRDAVTQGVDPVAGLERLSGSQEAVERIYLALRGRDGVELEPGDGSLLARWVQAGWLEVIGTRARLTPTGWLRLDALAAALTESRSR